MYALVNDVPSYPEFLPWCPESGMELHSDTESCASITIRKGPLNHRFTTRNQLQPGREIRMQLADGPFRHLEGFWRFEDVAGGRCRIELEIDFEFANPLIDLALGPVFHGIVGTLVDSFRKRARVVYGLRR